MLSLESPTKMAPEHELAAGQECVDGALDLRVATYRSLRAFRHASFP